MQKFIDKNDIELCFDACNCIDALIESANILVRNHKISVEYVNEIIDVFNQYGPYFVIAPGICLAHSKASDNVYKTSISLLTLKKPICFGHSENDPVNLVFTLASINNNSHLELLKRVVLFLSDVDNVDLLKQHKMTKESIEKAINEINL